MKAPNFLLMRRIAVAALVIPVIALIASCSSNTGSQPSNTDILTGRAWKLGSLPTGFDQALQTALASTPIPGLDANAIRSILLNTTFRYTSDGKVTVTATILGQPLTENGTWQFQNNERQIVETFPTTGLSSAFSGTYDINTLTTSSFVVQTIDAARIQFSFVPAN